MLFGEAQSKCQHIAGVPLRPGTAEELYKIYLSKGVHATTSIEGNTLTAEQVKRQIDGRLRLPKSQKYLGIEVQNIVDACNEISRDLLRGLDVEVTPERISHFNALVLRGLECEDHVTPGQYRRVSVGVMNYRGAPWDDCPYLIGRLCDWLNGTDFVATDPGWQFVHVVLKAILAHLYIAWIHPFGDGNGRTARLLEFQILMQSRLVPFPACHLFSNHYNKTRTRYLAELDRSSVPGVGIVPFVEYALQGFVDGLKEQLTHIQRQQWNVTWQDYVHDRFHDLDTPARTRQKHLVLDLPEGVTARRALTEVSTRVAVEYASKGEKTLTRDLNALVNMGLIVKKGGGYSPNREIILAFLPPGCEPDIGPPEGLLF